MSLRLRDDSFGSFLQSKAKQLPNRPLPEPPGMCILSGQILRQNVKEQLDREGIPTATLAQFTTIEELASALLEPTKAANRMLPEAVRDRLIEELFLNVDPDAEESGLLDVDIEALLLVEEYSALQELAKRLPYDEEDTRETLLNELDDFFRCTDATTDHDALEAILEEVESEFAKSQSSRAISAFLGIERFIQNQLSQLSINRQQSRSHLVSRARERADNEWDDQFSQIEWIAVAGISVFDNPTLRFLTALASQDSAPDVHVFVNAGSLEYNASRFDALEVETITPATETVNGLEQMRAETATNLFAATQGQATEQVDATFLEAPTNQRLVERVATDVRNLLQSGVSPRKILLIAPDAGSYKSLVEGAFETVGVPAFVETRRPFADIPAYRCFRTFVDVIDAVASNDEITYGELVDPLRLGYCPRGAHGPRWPISGQEFTKIEQELHRKQQFYNQSRDRYRDLGLQFEGWRSEIDEIPDFTADWDAVNEYLDTIETLAEEPPEDGEALEELFSSFLGSYVHQTVDHRRELYEGPAIDTTRTAITEIHPTSLAERVRSGLSEVGSHYDRMRQLFSHPPTWQEIGRSFSAVLGSDSYGKHHLDGQAIPLVDAGNAYFRNAEYVFLMGMNAEEFPGEAPTPTFLHANLRRKVYETASSGNQPYLHLDSRTTAYGEALDFYQAALSAASEGAEITLLHTYRDEQGNDIAWSSFVDLFDLQGEGEDSGEMVERVDVGDWLPGPRTDEEENSEPWSDVAERVSSRERLRTFLHQAHRDHPDSDPNVTPADIDAFADRLDPRPLHNHVLPRVDRYQEPPETIEIDTSEPAFEEINLETVSGEPLHPHELDLNGQCGLKYYYYQFLYNFEGGEPNREEIPKYYSSAPHFRLGQLPYIVRENYADPRFVEKWKWIVTELLPDRQSADTGLRQFDSPSQLREWILDQNEFEEYDLNTIYPNLLGELELVESEVTEGISRSWNWREGGVVEIDGHELSIPAYRLDIVRSGDSIYHLPIFFTRFSNRGDSALKACRSQPIWEADEETHTICLQCTECEDCIYNSKYVIDHRMLAGQEYEGQELGNKVVGIGMQEQYAGPDDGNRVVAMMNNYTEKFHPFDSDGVFENLRKRGFPGSWEEKHSTWRDNFLEQAEQFSGSRIQLEANMELVNQDECLDCVYRNLCSVPTRGGAD